MLPDERRARVVELVRQHKASRTGLSRFIGRGDGYLSSYLNRRVPYDLTEQDRDLLARYFGVDKDTLRAAPVKQGRPVDRAEVFVAERIDAISEERMSRASSFG